MRREVGETMRLQDRYRKPGEEAGGGRGGEKDFEGRRECVVLIGQL